MPRTLITFAKLSTSPILIALALVLVAGCEGGREVEPTLMSPPAFDPIPIALDTTVHLSLAEFPDSVFWTIVESVAVAIVKPLPCPPETVFAMPPGWWYSIEDFLEWSRRFGVGQIPNWPDSVFILSEREE